MGGKELKIMFTSPVVTVFFFLALFKLSKTTKDSTPLRINNLNTSLRSLGHYRNLDSRGLHAASFVY